MTCFLWFGFKHPLLKTLLFFWLSGILGFIAQGLFNNMETSGFLAFSINWMTVVFSLKIFSVATELKLPFKVYNFVLGTSIVVGSLLLYSGFSYTSASAVFCGVCALVLFHGATRTASDVDSDIITQGYRVLLIFDGLHFLDYPILRPVAEYAVIGFSLTLMFFFCFAIFVPIFIMRKISSDYNQELINEVAIRTSQLKASNTQLTLAFENLKTKKDTIDSILKENQSRLAAIVHDLTNPLTIIFYNFSLLMANPEKFSSQLSTKAEKLKRAITAVDNILKDARSSYATKLGKNNISLHQVSLEIIVRDVVDLFEDRLKEKNVNLVFDSNELKKYRVLCNDAWLRNHVLSNLISNAIKFSHVGGTIAIHATSIDGKVVLSIQDHGIGIALDRRSKIFELDHTTSSLGTRGEKGTGLGLPIVKQYIELMGGGIRIAENTEPGTCFEVTLNNAA